ncbi:patatin-like phospholipase family protein [Janibacter sp. GXQ6167]|uniref:patatin-like phospholipase family protein n=1 Tax=Janibacter sp. GXQ6167 TaxID=3240791 RepID=UPI003526197F
MSQPSRVALALGSGGARGYAHIGALQVLRERGHEVAAIAGTSMGALVGGLTAAGKLEEYTEWALSLTSRAVFMMLDPTLSAPGAIRAKPVLRVVNELLEGARIEDLPIPFTAIACDIDARREVWFQHGPVAVAVRASIAIPSVITPVIVNGRILVDGGILNPVPVEPITGAGADFTVAISLSGDRAGRQSPVESSAPRTNPDTVMQRLRAWLPTKAESPGDAVEEVAAVAESAVSLGLPEEIHDLPPGLKVSDVISKSMDATSALVARYRLAGHPPDVLVRVPVDACGTMDFHRAAEMIELGRELTEKALDEAGR